MKREQIENYLQTEYQRSCKCGKVHSIVTQEDNGPEYYTHIYILCECGEYVKFKLPVN
jgi:hypothetical protein